MSKIVLNDVTNLNALSVINDNFDKLEQELQDKVLYRSNPTGEPNELNSDIDANGNSIYNVQDLTITGGFTVGGVDVSSYIEQAQLAADDAEASATAASNSATAAGVSAASANADAISADADATAAAASAASAASSASTATTQAGIATTGGNTATTQAGIATTKASEASASAAAADASADAALISETNAGTSASDASTSASSAAASAAAAAAALDNFDDRYLGSKSVAPLLDNDGNPLVQGQLYYNDGTIVADDKGMWVYDGATWIQTTAASQAILVTYEFVATGGQTVFSGNDANAVLLAYTVGSILVTLNGTRLRPGEDYTATDGATITLAVAATAGDELVVDAFSTFDIANVYTKTETYTKSEIDTALSGKLSTANGAVGTNNLATGAVTPAKLSQPLTLGTAVASTSGTSIDFTGIPSWVKRITVMFNGVSTNGTSDILIRIGTSSVETTGYASSSVALSGSVAGATNTTGFNIGGNYLASASILQGQVVISTIGSNKWTASGLIGRSDTAYSYTCNGSKTTSNTIDILRITTVNGTDTFDAGSINILYE